MGLAKRVIENLNPLQIASPKDTTLVKEKVFNPKSSLGLKRKDMPQIEDKDQEHFFKWLSSHGVKNSKGMMDPNQIRPSQSEINVDASQALADSHSPKLSKPVIISRDGYVIDGHHRWLAHTILKNKSINIIKVDMDAKKLIELMKTYDKAKYKSITNESRVSKILEKMGAILEKLIVVNKGAKFGQIVILAGGGGSGKDFSIDNFIDSSSYKIFDVDALKLLAIAVAKKNGNTEIANLDLKKPEDVFKLHQYVDDKGFESKAFDGFIKAYKGSKQLPNIILNVTLKTTKKVSEKLEELAVLGYKKEDTHIIWVAAEYQVALENNSKRDRVVPEDILFQTHKGAAETMSSILKGNIPPMVNGEVYVVFSDERLSVPLDKLNRADKSPISGKAGRKLVAIKDFLYSKVKESGKAIKSEAEVKKDVYTILKAMVPEEVKHLFV